MLVNVIRLKNKIGVVIIEREVVNLLFVDDIV